MIGERVATGREITVSGVLILISASLITRTPRLVVIRPRLILITRGLVTIRPRLILVTRRLVAIARRTIADPTSRTESEDNLKLATTDELTGAWTRKFGLEEVSRELERAHRTGATLVLAFIDVDGLKQVNDSQGHLVGDALLQLVGETLRANVRPYDVIVRYGGDELVCAMPNLSGAEARARFETIATSLTAINAEHSVTFGLAEAEPADSLQELIARADADLLEARRSAQND